MQWIVQSLLSAIFLGLYDLAKKSAVRENAVPAVLLPLALRWYWKDRALQPFTWRWTIPAIAVNLLIADFLYFSALSDPDALLAIISPLRRTSVVISFVFGIAIFSEKNWKRKAALIAVMLCGVALVSYKPA